VLGGKGHGGNWAKQPAGIDVSVEHRYRAPSNLPTVVQLAPLPSRRATSFLRTWSAICAGWLNYRGMVREITSLAVGRRSAVLQAPRQRRRAEPRPTPAYPLAV